MPKKPTAKVVEDAIAALDTVRREWLRRPGVTAVDVGYKIKDDALTDDVAVRVHVERKVAPAELAKTEVFNESGKAVKKLKGFPIDVIEATYVPSTAPIALEDDDALQAIDRKTAIDPLIGGISCGNPRVTAGTLGAIVFDRASCKPMILSNWHILAGSSSAAVGEDILQPGRIDGGTDVVASLTKMRLDSRMDAAVATLNGSRRHSRDILGLGAIRGMDTATLGMNVVKSGRTTGITEGVVDGVSLSTAINYGDPGVVSFSNQIRIVPRAPWPAVNYEVSQGGDSGSVWLNEANDRAIGLHFAGERNPAPSAENAICSPIQPIATELNFSFLPVLCYPKLKIPPIRLIPHFWHLCRRYPWLCGPPWVPVKPPFPFPDPPPFGGRFGPFGGGFPGAGGEAGSGGCGCSEGFDAEEYARALAEFGEEY